MRKLILLAMLSALALPGPHAFAQDNVRCVPLMQDWNAARSSLDAAGMRDFRAAVPTFCPELTVTIDRAVADLETARLAEQAARAQDAEDRRQAQEAAAQAERARAEREQQEAQALRDQLDRERSAREAQEAELARLRERAAAAEFEAAQAAAERAEAERAAQLAAAQRAEAERAAQIAAQSAYADPSYPSADVPTDQWLLGTWHMTFRARGGLGGMRDWSGDAEFYRGASGVEARITVYLTDEPDKFFTQRSLVEIYGSVIQMEDHETISENFIGPYRPDDYYLTRSGDRLIGRSTVAQDLELIR